MSDDTIAVRRDDVRQILEGHVVEDYEGLPRTLEAFHRLGDAVKAPGGAEAPLPDGEFGHVELPGFVQHTGWVTEGTRAGCPVLVIRDWDGRKIAEVVPQAMRQFIALPTPLKRPEPQAALPAGAGFDYEYDDANPF
jgi:hypothetical protein